MQSALDLNALDLVDRARPHGRGPVGRLEVEGLSLTGVPTAHLAADQKSKPWDSVYVPWTKGEGLARVACMAVKRHRGAIALRRELRNICMYAAHHHLL